jgi:hypothetical protein
MCDFLYIVLRKWRIRGGDWDDGRCEKSRNTGRPRKGKGSRSCVSTGWETTGGAEGGSLDLTLLRNPVYWNSRMR